MKHKLFSAPAGLVLAFIAFIAFVAGGYSYNQNTPLQQVTDGYRNNLNALGQSIKTTKETTLRAKSGKAGIEGIRADFLKVRAAFKNVEFLLEYFDPQSVKDYINGAPLPKIERNSTDMTVLQPHGLQVIDDLLYADDAENNIDTLVKELELLDTKYQAINQYQQKQYISERNLFEAARLELIRITSLGITGFDTPGSGNALTDAENALQPLLKMAQAYSSQLKGEMGTEFEGTLLAATMYLETNTDFDSFNRFNFIRLFINPAFKLFKDVQLSLGIETIYESSSQKVAINHLADNIFETEILNPEYFSNSGDKVANPQKAELGKLLFFDPVLSTNNKRACASCHQPSKAFTDGEARSIAIDFKGTVSRNAPTLVNSVFADRFFYDLRTEKIENQFEHVILSEQEFNTSYPEISSKLVQSEGYKKMFADVFPQYKGEINKQSIAEAIGAYLKTIVSFNSKFDKNIRDNGSTIKKENALSNQEINGFNLFMGKAVCGTCHFAPTFAGLVPPNFVENESEVLGVPATKDTINALLDSDIGRFGGRMKEKTPFNMFAFKTMTVRNAALTAPYMHNGVYTTLEEVVDFYNKGGGQGLGIQLDNQTLPFDKLNLTESEKSDIVAFMKTLTDTTGLNTIPAKLPTFDAKPEWNKRVVGGEY